MRDYTGPRLTESAVFPAGGTRGDRPMDVQLERRMTFIVKGKPGFCFVCGGNTDIRLHATGLCDDCCRYILSLSDQRQAVK